MYSEPSSTPMTGFLPPTVHWTWYHVIRTPLGSSGLINKCSLDIYNNNKWAGCILGACGLQNKLFDQQNSVYPGIWNLEGFLDDIIFLICFLDNETEALKALKNYPRAQSPYKSSEILGLHSVLSDKIWLSLEAKTKCKKTADLKKTGKTKRSLISLFRNLCK